MPKTVVIASQNTHKIKEISAILGENIFRLLSLNDFPAIGEIEETGATFEENALLKARTVFRQTGLLTLSDDSGLEVDYLNGAPGVYSARYAGEAKDYRANNQKLLLALEGIPQAQRGAQFRCVAAIVAAGGEEIVEGIVRGRIAETPRGSSGFGYDPLFIPEGYQQTFSEMGEAPKNRLSHRGRAFRKAKMVVDRLLREE